MQVCVNATVAYTQIYIYTHTYVRIRTRIYLSIYIYIYILHALILESLGSRGFTEAGKIAKVKEGILKRLKEQAGCHLAVAQYFEEVWLHRS